MSKQTAKAGAAQLLALLNAGTFDAETSKVLKAALAGESTELPLEVIPPKGKMRALVKIGDYGNKHFKFKPKGLSPALVRAVVELCETDDGRKRLLAVCEEAEEAKEE